MNIAYPFCPQCDARIHPFDDMILAKAYIHGSDSQAGRWAAEMSERSLAMLTDIFGPEHMQAVREFDFDEAA